MNSKNYIIVNPIIIIGFEFQKDSIAQTQNETRTKGTANKIINQRKQPSIHP